MARKFMKTEFQAAGMDKPRMPLLHGAGLFLAFTSLNLLAYAVFVYGSAIRQHSPGGEYPFEILAASLWLVVPLSASLVIVLRAKFRFLAIGVTGYCLLSWIFSCVWAATIYSTAQVTENTPWVESRLSMICRSYCPDGVWEDFTLRRQGQFNHAVEEWRKYQGVDDSI